MTKPPRTFAVSDRISHFQYGLGTIAAFEQNYTVIDFDRHGRRKFVTSMVQLEPSDVLAPTRPTPKPRAAKGAAKAAKAAKADKTATAAKADKADKVAKPAKGKAAAK